ncbi:unnamed protein product [Prorocentrum cordatum]|uniref:EF-hand domain-containing protein n=1 Tax=Prorocentrum cordatum TaxID=2364126 RepID=A0ABN9PEY9_9DINO|nr:unnamed protein product [Polarella glacialis]
MQEHKKKMEGFEKQVTAIEKEHNARLQDYNQLKEKMEKAGATFQEFEKMDVKYTEDIAFQQQKLDKLKAAAEQEKANAKKLLEDAEDLRNEAPTREKELESAKRFRASQEEKLEKIKSGLKGKAEELRPLKEAKEAQLVPIQKKLTEVRKVVDVAKTEADFIREKTEGVAKQIEEIKGQHEQCSETLRARQEDAKEASKRKTYSLRLVGEGRKKLEATSAQIEQLGREVLAMQAKAAEAKNQHEEEHDRGRLIRSVYEQAKAGRLKGVHGRLGDLGTIQKKYDVAVSTACGYLNAIVVDTTEDAQAVIQFCREKELGQCTCICLDKQKHLEAQARQPIQTPEDVPRLFDLIQPTKEEYRVAFFFALGATLVAKDLDEASRVAYGKKRWRVVSLMGGLIETNGTMSGGGGKVQRGGMRASLCQFSTEEVKAFEQAYEKGREQVRVLRQEKASLEEALQQTEKEIAEAELQEKKCSMEAASLQKQVDAYGKRLAELKVPSLSSGDKAKLKDLDKLINSRSSELNKVQAEHQAVEDEVRKLHDQIMNIGGEELKNATAKVEEATKKCEELRKNIKKALLDADNMVKNSKVAEESAKASLKDQAKTEKELARLKEEHAKLDDKAEQVLNTYNEIKEELVQKDELLQKLRQKREEVIGQAACSRHRPSAPRLRATATAAMGEAADGMLVAIAELLKKKRIRSSDLFRTTSSSGDGQATAEELRAAALRQVDKTQPSAPASRPSKSKLMDKDKEEFRQIFCLFKQLCRTGSSGEPELVEWDESGNIAADDLEQLLETVGLKLSSSELNGIIKDLDKNNDGTIDFEEFCSSTTEQIQLDYSQEEISRAFASFQKNSPDGLIKVKDLREALKTHMYHEMIDAEINELIFQYKDSFVRLPGSDEEYRKGFSLSAAHTLG